MSAITAGHRESIARLTDRDVRALTECMTVLEDTGSVRGADGLYEVSSQSGRTYTVDAYGKSCTCPDACYNDLVCKHVRRVMFACGMRPIPGDVDPDVLDGHIGEHVEATPIVSQVVADGGSALADDNTASDGDTDADIDAGTDADGERPDDCACPGPDDAFVCWPCYREGFDTPNAESDG